MSDFGAVPDATDFHKLTFRLDCLVKRLVCVLCPTSARDITNQEL
jgi:hypothetical protein